MKRPQLLLSGILAVAGLVCAAQEAQQSFTLSGSVDAATAYSQQNKDSAFANLAPYSDLGAYGLINGKLSFSRDYTSLALLDFNFRDAAQLKHQNAATLETLSFTINELYSDLNFGDLFYLRLGKQRLSWGSGYVFNPSDPINPPKDPTNQRAAREGVPALKAEIIAKPVSLMAFSVLYDDFSELGYGLKLSSSAIPNSDISLSGYWSPSQSWTGALNASIAPFYDSPGWDTVQIWFEGSGYGMGRYAHYVAGPLPGSALSSTASGPQFAALAGASAQIPLLNTIALAEYYHLSEGLSPSDLASVYQALRSSDAAVVAASSAWFGELAARPGRQASDYLFISLAQPTVTDSGDPFFDKLGLSLACLINLVDGSTFASGAISLNHVKNTSIDLDLAWARGDPDTEFGNALTRLSMGLHVKVFF